jgi:hypothetical protein
MRVLLLSLLVACGGSVVTNGDGGLDGSQPDSTTSDVVTGACSGASVCTSGITQQDGGPASTSHDPGQACIACHAQVAGPLFAVAGTVYPSCHEPDLCNGMSGVTVTISDSNANVTKLMTNSSGNFYTMATTAIAKPFTATLTYVDTSQVTHQSTTTTPHADGDCNTCHTENGANGAAGRLFVP